MNQKKMGAFIKTLRKENNLTQEQLAEALGVSNRTVSRWETGSNIPDLDMLIILADYFDVEIKELIEGERLKEKEIFTEPKTIKAGSIYNCFMLSSFGYISNNTQQKISTKTLTKKSQEIYFL